VILQCCNQNSGLSYENMYLTITYTVYIIYSLLHLGYGTYLKPDINMLACTDTDPVLVSGPILLISVSVKNASHQNMKLRMKREAVFRNILNCANRMTQNSSVHFLRRLCQRKAANKVK